MADQKLITVSCPECSKKTFTISENILDDDKYIDIVCNECGSTVRISKPKDESIFVQCL